MSRADVSRFYEGAALCVTPVGADIGAVRTLGLMSEQPLK
jgi:hypothetical protein